MNTFYKFNRKEKSFESCTAKELFSKPMYKEIKGDCVLTFVGMNEPHFIIFERVGADTNIHGKYYSYKEAKTKFKELIKRRKK
jgi:hypothetical protein